MIAAISGGDVATGAAWVGPKVGKSFSNFVLAHCRDYAEGGASKVSMINIWFSITHLMFQ